MGHQWISAEENPAVRQSLETVRVVTALSGLRTILALDLLAAFVDVPMSSLDTGLRNGPVAASEVERVVQGSYVGYRHPDAAWTTLPSPVAAVGAGVVFARWFADWLDQAEPERRDRGDARATAKAVAAAARAAGKTALADRIDGVYRGNGKRKPSPPVGGDEKGESAAAASAAAMAVVPAGRRAASRLPARTTAGILAGTAILLAGAVAGVAMLSEGGAAANGVRSGALGSVSADGEGTTGPVGTPSAGADATSAPTRSVSAATTAGVSGQASNSAGSGSTGQLLAAFVSGGAPHSTATATVNSKANTSSGSGNGTGTGSGAGGTVVTSAPGTTTSTTAGSATSSSAAPATSTSAVTDPSTSAAATATASNQGCVDLLGLVTVCL